MSWSGANIRALQNVCVIEFADGLKPLCAHGKCVYEALEGKPTLCHSQGHARRVHKSSVLNAVFSQQYCSSYATTETDQVAIVAKIDKGLQEVFVRPNETCRLACGSCIRTKCSCDLPIVRDDLYGRQIPFLTSGGGGNLLFSTIGPVGYGVCGGSSLSLSISHIARKE
jgi:hypothetical protein